MISGFSVVSLWLGCFVLGSFGLIVVLCFPLQHQQKQNLKRDAQMGGLCGGLLPPRLAQDEQHPAQPAEEMSEAGHPFDMLVSLSWSMLSSGSKIRRLTFCFWVPKGHGENY